MPLYEYTCDQHGPFELVRPMREFRAPAPCPECAVPGARLLSSPNLATMARSEVLARDRNEQSRHEPRVSRCAHGHRGCSGHHGGLGGHGGHASKQDKPSPSREPAPGRLQAYTGPRPWVVEHS